MMKIFTKLLLTGLMFLFVWMEGAQAQLAIKYPMSVTTGTYSSISGTGTNIPAMAADNNQQNLTGLPGFTVNGTTYTNARVSSNGWLILYGATAPTATTESSILSTDVTNGAVTFAPMNADLNSKTGSAFYYQTIGNENIFEWKSYTRYSYTDELNFQIRLNTVSGIVTFVYGTCTPDSKTSYFQVGWKTNAATAANWATDINNLMLDVTGSPNTCTWADAVTGNANSSTMYFNSANSGVIPTSGLTFTWTPQSNPDPVRTFSAVSGITSSGATLTWTAPSGATQYNVRYRAVGSCTWTNFSGNPVASATATITGLSAGTYYQYQVQAMTSGGNKSIWSHIPNAAGTGNGYVATGSFQTTITCFPPTALTGVATSPTTANLSWTAAVPAPGSGYVWEVRSSGAGGSGPTGLATSGSVGAGVLTASATGLTGGTTYTLYVRSNCGGDDYSTWAASATFTTPSVTGVPWTEGFATVTTPTGWTTTDWLIGSTRGVTGNPGNNIYKNIYSATTSGKFFTTINVGPIVAGNHLSFDYKASNYASPYSPPASGSGNFVVAISTDYGATYTTLETVNNDGVAGWRSKDYLLSSYAGQYVKIKITGNWVSGDWDYGFDNFKIETPPSCLPPTALSGTPTSTTTANISWTAPSPAPSNGYQYAVTTSATPPGSGTPFAGTSTSVSGLTANTTYYLHVRSDCGGSGYSPWATSAAFKTPCDAVTSYTQNWDGVTTPALPDCYYKVGSLGSVYTQTSNPSSSPNTLYIYATSLTTQPTLALQPVSNAGANTHWLRFKLRANLTVGDVLQVGYLTDPNNASSFVLLQEFTAASLTYTEYTCDPGTAPGSNQVLALRAKGSSGYSMLVDDLAWEPKPSCIAPTALSGTPTSSTTANISWTAPSPAPSIGYQYAVTTSATPPGSGTPFAGTSTSVSGLTANTTYYLHVRSDCGGSGYSPWATSAAFKTPCDAASIPFFEGFESGYTDQTAVGGCWSQEALTGTNPWTANSSQTSYNRTPRTGSFNAYLRYGNERWLFYPVTLTGGTTYAFSVYARQDGSTSTDASITLAYGTAPSNAGMTNTVVNAQGIINGTYQEVAGNFTPASSGTYYIGIKGNINFSPYYISLDDISVTLAPTCLPPTAVTVSSLDATSVGLGWTAPVSPPSNGYEYELRTSGAPGSGPTGLVNSGTTSSTSISFSSLTAGTQYTFYIRSDCAGSGYSTWASRAFTTIGCMSFTQAPANGATGVSVNPIQFDWTTVPGMASFDFYWEDNTPPALVGNYNLTPPIVITPNFDTEPFGQTYYWKFEPKAADGSKAIPACAIQSYTYETNPLPGSCVSSPFGQYPSSTFVPTCTGTAQNITTVGYAGEYSLVTLTAGFTYTFTSSIGTDIITIGAPITPVATGTGSVTYTPAVSGNYRFYTHIAGCGSQNSSRTRSVACVVVNNECPGSINLTPVAGKFTDPGTQSLASATLSGVPIPGGCPGTYVRDMWYKLTTDNDGNVNEDFTVSVTPATGVDIGLALYDGSCGSLIALACNDLAAAGISETITWTDPFTGGNIEIRGNKTYYVRVMLTSGSTAGTFTINAGGPALPVNLIYFTARAINGKQVGLNWKVAAESLLDGYIVEHSTDGRNFEAIGKVKAAQKSSYAFVHDNPAQGINYYRLRMLDDNGAFKLSEVRQVVFTNGKLLSLYPNPTSGLVYVSGLEGVKNGAYVNIYNEMGISVFSGKIGGDELASKGIDMSMYAPGAYVIRVISDEVNTTMRFVKE